MSSLTERTTPRGLTIFEQLFELLEHPNSTWEEKERELKRRLIPLIESRAGVIEPILVAYTKEEGGQSVIGRFVWRNPWNPACLETMARRDPLEQSNRTGEMVIHKDYYEWSQRSVIRQLMLHIEDRLRDSVVVSDEQHHWQPVFQEVKDDG